MSKDVVTVPPGADYFTIDRVLAGPRALIWKCYTRPEHLARFWGPRDAKTAATVDPQGRRRVAHDVDLCEWQQLWLCERLSRTGGARAHPLSRCAQ